MIGTLTKRAFSHFALHRKEFTEKMQRLTSGLIRRAGASAAACATQPRTVTAAASSAGAAAALAATAARWPAAAASVAPMASSFSRGAATTAAPGPRPFRVLGVQQVALGGLDKGKLAALWVDVLGLEKVTTYRSEKENVDEDVLRAGRGPFAVEVDIMQPINKEKAPKVHEPPLNHIGLWVDDLPAAVQWLTEKGVRFAPGGIRKGATGLNITFIHPKGNEASPLSGEGVLIELVQAPKEVIEAFDKLK